MSSVEHMFEVPSSWVRHIVPRRGGVPGPELPHRPVLDAALAEELARVVVRLPVILGHPETPAEVAVAGKAYVEDAASAPLGDAVAAAVLIRRIGRSAQVSLDSLVDTWVAGAGVRHAAWAVAELAGLYLGTDRTGATDLVTWAHPDRPRQAFLREGWMQLVLRLRAHLAVATGDEHRAVVADLAALRDDPRLLCRLTATLLAPTETGWVDEDCAAFAGLRDEMLCRLLLPAVGTRRQLDLLLQVMAPEWVFWDEPTILTLAAEIGPDLEPVLVHWLATGALTAAAVAWTATILAAIPTDTAFDALAHRSGWRQVQPALAEAIHRFPERALRRLAEGPAHPMAEVLLTRHVRADRGRAARLLLALGEAAAARVRAVLQADAGPEAPADAVPAVLPVPPWAARRPGAPVVAGLVCPDPPAVPRRGSGPWAAASADALLDRVGPDVAGWMAGWLARSEQARPVAREWLRRRPDGAARALIPAALARPGTARRDAERALHLIVRCGHRDVVLAAAEQYGPPALDGVRALLDGDPLHVLPARIPAVPDWADPASLSRPRLRAGGVLPAGPARHLVTMLAMSTLDEPYAGVALVRRAGDPASLAEFGWALFQSWRAAGRPAAHRWAFTALGLLGDDTTVTRLAPIVRDWHAYGEHANARAGVDVLAALGTPAALRQLQRLAGQPGTARLKEHARRKAAEVAAAAGLSADELADRLVPDFGLAADGSLSLDYGSRRFTVWFDEQLRPFVTDADGRRRRDLPKPGVKDDPVVAVASYQRFVGLRKDVRTVASDQVRRLELAMVSQRRWSGADFRRFFVGHPLLWHVVRRLVWAVYGVDGSVVTGFRVAEDRTFADVGEEVVMLADDAVVGVVHPLQLGDAVSAWAEVFADYEILQPFPQLGRDVHTLTGDERAAQSLTHLVGRKTPTGKLLGLERRGWRREEPQDGGHQGYISKPVPGGFEVVVDLNPGIAIGSIDIFPEQVLQDIWVCGSQESRWHRQGQHRLGDLDPVTASEIIRELQEVTS
ncbi:hypothetical protein GCM10010399_89510 [Dactylosporangium fulvum]|uniref:DUF4132 domain-containing protein n=1 Tax=Dactylosporangium fulvum TaxID=53359 RepID=UPI0031CE535E